MSTIIFGILALLMIAAFFEGSETAIFSLSRSRLESLAQSGRKPAKILRELLTKPRPVLATLLFGATLCEMGVGVLMAVAGHDLVEKFNLPESKLPFVVLGLDLIVTVIILVFGEMLPKLMATKYTETFAFVVSAPTKWLTFFFKPFVTGFIVASESILKMIGISLSSSPTVTREEIQTLVSVGENTGVLEPEEAEMVEGFFGFRQRVASEIMTPRVKMVALHEDTTVATALEKIREHGFSRYPIYGETIDQIKGVLYAKDLLARVDQPQLGIGQLARPVHFVPETKALSDLLKELQTARVHIAIILDEYGGTHGVVTIEDLLEEIFGEIKDEYDEDETAPYQKQLDGSLVTDAGFALHELCELLEMPIEEDEVDTVGGLMVNQLGRVPVVGEEVTLQGYVFKALEVKGQRLTKVHVSPEPKIEGGENNEF